MDTLAGIRARLPAYPIELPFPDISRWSKGNSGIDYIHTFDSGIPGPHVMVMALIHGNEVCGAITVDLLLEAGLRPIKGRLSFGFANVAAYRRFSRKDPDAARYVEEDMNRVWSDDTLDGMRNTVDLKRAREMRPFLNTVDMLLDIHSMHEASPPLLMCGPLEKGRTLAAERAQANVSGSGHAPLLSVLVQPRVIGMALYYMMLSISVYGVSCWLPTLVKGFGVSNTTNGLLNIIPWLMATIVLAWLPSKLRGGHHAITAMLVAALLGFACFLSAVFLPTNTLRFAALCFGAPCMYLLIPCFWTLPSKFLFGAQAAAGIAAINSLGNIGGFIAQNLVPWVRETSGSVKAPMLIPASCLLLFAAITVPILRRAKRTSVAGTGR